MAVTRKLPTWISYWFILTCPVVLWDVGYCYLRPRSMVGGDLHWIWWPYALQQELDHVYGLPSFNSGDGFTNAQSLLNIFETIGSLSYVYLAHISKSPVAPLVGFGAALATFAKTVLYWAQEYYCGFCAIGHNSVPRLALWALTNGLWIVFPFIIVLQLGSHLAGSLRIAAKTEAATKKTKSK
ncbi:hypothetical protein FA15DRAFT_669972 [Coprinopsis marcescibilis]|uniref:EXPERA domain-containing protein n=1 Tax=Coprinopsis marcescibilis TaxID=230819 RepID=A0A5C3KTS3_COPMA|nr:hypothetical protein FA15DRAFT_669972 [Coprinopsis marcescibilis]